MRLEVWAILPPLLPFLVSLLVIAITLFFTMAREARHTARRMSVTFLGGGMGLARGMIFAVGTGDPADYAEPLVVLEIVRHGPFDNVVTAFCRPPHTPRWCWRPLLALGRAADWLHLPLLEFLP